MTHDFLIGLALGLASGIFLAFAAIAALLYIDHRRIVRRRRDR